MAMIAKSMSTATVWSTLDVLSRQGLQFGISIALARLLTPDAFGVIAIVMVFTSLAGVIADAGFGSAIVQKQDANQTDESTMFWATLGSATVFAVCLSLAAPVIAAWFHQPAIVPVIIALSPVMILSAAGSIQLNLMCKKLDFKTQAKIGFVQLVISGGVAIVLAAAGAGVWALVGQTISSAASSAALYWAASRWRPSWTFSTTSLRELFSFGGFMMAANVADTIAMRASSFFVGFSYSARDLGFYTRAETTATLPGALLVRIMPRVALPAYSRIAHDRPALAREVATGQELVALISTPAMFGLAAIAGPLVLTLFGAKWAPSIPLLQALAFAGLGIPYQVVNLSALMALGRSRTFFAMNLAKRVIGLALVFIAAQVGPLAIAWAVVSGAAVSMALDMVVPGRILGLSVWSQVRAAGPIFFAGGVMGAVVLAFVHFSGLSAPVTLVAALVLGAAIYGPAAALLRLRPVLRVASCAVAALSLGRKNDLVEAFPSDAGGRSSLSALRHGLHTNARLGSGSPDGRLDSTKVQGKRP